MPKTSDLLFGVRNLLFVSLCLLFLNAAIATLLNLANVTYPGDAVANLLLWVAVLIGSYATSSTLAQINRNPWLFGLVVGAVFGLIVFLVLALIYGVSGGLSAGSLAGLIPLVILYAALGLVGSFVGALFGNPRTSLS